MSKYIAVVDKEFKVIFPDFVECESVGKDLNDALKRAQEALEFHVSFIRAYGEELPEPTTLKQIKKDYPKSCLSNILTHRTIYIK